MASALTRTEHYVSRKDGRVYYVQVGQGEPLLLLHPVGRSGWSWRRIIDRFAEHFTCYNVDLPGYDHSDIPPRQYSVEDYVQAIMDYVQESPRLWMCWLAQESPRHPYWGATGVR